MRRRKFEMKEKEGVGTKVVRVDQRSPERDMTDHEATIEQGWVTSQKGKGIKYKETNNFKYKHKSLHGPPKWTPN